MFGTADDGPPGQSGVQVPFRIGAQHADELRRAAMAAEQHLPSSATCSRFMFTVVAAEPDEARSGECRVGLAAVVEGGDAEAPGAGIAID